MPTKRRRIDRKQQMNISADALRAWREKDWRGLYYLLKLRPWEIHPLDVDEGCPYPPGSAGHGSWAKAQELAAALEAQSNE